MASLHRETGDFVSCYKDGCPVCLSIEKPVVFFVFFLPDRKARSRLVLLLHHPQKR